MTAISLARLPDRVPVKLAISISPELHQRLTAFASLYEQTYGVAEPVTELVPAMLERFLDADRNFVRAERHNTARARLR